MERPVLRTDLWIAPLLAAGLSAAWTLRGWDALAALHLPDTDDVTRLQQIRDWLAGQSFADLTQYRLGAGVPMHWSRLADLVPAALIAALTPLLGGHGATLVAVILWPALLFAAALALTGSVAGRLEAPPRTAMLIAALAYPATTIFLPGRIDHHGLQIVLLLGAARAMVAASGAPSGAVAALCSAAGLVVGLETAPLLALIAVMIWYGWYRGLPTGEARLLSYGLTLAAALALGALVFGGNAWDYAACDAFDRQSWTLAELGAGAAIGLALGGRVLTAPRRRLAISTVGAAVVALLGWRLIADCLHPYGAVDPWLAELWLRDVGEAQPLFAADPATSIGYAGLMLAGIAATLWRMRRHPAGRWPAWLVRQIGALLITCLQLRGAYAGAMLAAPPLAMIVAAARAGGGVRLAAAWLASAGLVYPIAAQAISHLPIWGTVNVLDAGGTARAACSNATTLGRLARLPAGTVIAPIDSGPYILAATPHRVLGAPYHRNNAGNAAMYRFFLSVPGTAHAIARHWRVNYVLFCADGLAAHPMDVAQQRRSLRAALDAGQVPGWLRPVGGAETGPRIYTVDLRLPIIAPAH